MALSGQLQMDEKLLPEPFLMTESVDGNHTLRRFSSALQPLKRWLLHGL